MSEGAAYGIFFALFFAVAVLLEGGCGASISPNDSRHLLEKEGFTNVKQVDRHVFFVSLQGCGQQDAVRFDFEATNPLGKRVRINVCDGVMKGATVRG
jgi:hypothetical protein